jgi:hypothetical protein
LTASVTQPSPKLSHATIVTGLRPEHGPHRHFDRAGIRSGDDADAVGGGDAEDFAGELDRVDQPALAELGAMGAAERAEREALGVPARRLGAGTGRKMGTGGAVGRLVGTRNGRAWQ